MYEGVKAWENEVEMFVDAGAKGEGGRERGERRRRRTMIVAGLGMTYTVFEDERCVLLTMLAQTRSARSVQTRSKLVMDRTGVPATTVPAPTVTPDTTFKHTVQIGTQHQVVSLRGGCKMRPCLVHLSAEEIDSEIENPKSAISYDHDPGYDLQRYLAWPRRACKRSNSKIMRIPSRKTAKKSRTRQPSSTIRQALSQAALEVCVCDFFKSPHRSSCT